MLIVSRPKREIDGRLSAIFAATFNRRSIVKVRGRQNESRPERRQQGN
jgi:hypothetical protein